MWMALVGKFLDGKTIAGFLIAVKKVLIIFKTDLPQPSVSVSENSKLY